MQSHKNVPSHCSRVIRCGMSHLPIVVVDIFVDKKAVQLYFDLIQHEGN